MSETNTDKYVLKGVDSGMEYRLKDGTEWSSCTDEPMLFEIPEKMIKYYIRYKATGDKKESQVREISLYTVPGEPKVSFNSTSEKFSGLTTGMEISINDGEFIPVTNKIIQDGVTPYIDQLTTES